MIALYLHMSIATYILYVLNYRLYCDLIILKIGDGLMSRSSNNFFRMEMLLLKIIEIGNGEYYGYKIVQQLIISLNQKEKNILTNFTLITWI